jgi:hypothetical protein
MKLKIEIDLDGLPSNERINVKTLPTIATPHDDQIADGREIWYRELKNGADRWVRIEGRGLSPLECENIIIRMSPGNPDVLEDVPTGYHDHYGVIVFDEHPNNLYIQSVKLESLKIIGYEDSRCNFPPLVD